MTAIVIIDGNWGIGSAGRQLFTMPKDLRHYNETTTGGVLVVGRRTVATFPGGKPLPNRVNIILSKDESYSVEGAIVTNFQGLAKALAPYKKAGRKIFVCGGESVYKLLLPYCGDAIVSKVRKAGRNPDSYFPNLDRLEEWQLLTQGPWIVDEEGDFSVCVYKNNGVKTLTSVTLDPLATHGLEKKGRHVIWA